MAFTSAEEIITALKKQLGLDEDTYAVMQIWERELGHLARYAELAAVKKGKLIVEVASPAHFQELTLRKRELVGKINQHFGRTAVVKGITLRLKK